MTREPLAIDNLHIVIKVLAVVQLLGMAHRSIPSSNQGVQDPGFTGYPEVFQFREMMRTLSFSTPASMRLAAQHGLGQLFVAGENLDAMTAQVRQFNTIRAAHGLPPDQPTTLVWMYCATTTAEAEEGWEYFYNQLQAAQHHYFEWNNPGFAGIPGYEEYLKRQTADVGVADAGFAARR